MIIGTIDKYLDLTKSRSKVKNLMQFKTDAIKSFRGGPKPSQQLNLFSKMVMITHASFAVLSIIYHGLNFVPNTFPLIIGKLAKR